MKIYKILAVMLLIVFTSTPKTWASNDELTEEDLAEDLRIHNQILTILNLNRSPQNIINEVLGSQAPQIPTERKSKMQQRYEFYYQGYRHRMNQLFISPSIERINQIHLDQYYVAGLLVPPLESEIMNENISILDKNVQVLEVIGISGAIQYATKRLKKDFMEGKI